MRNQVVSHEDWPKARLERLAADKESPRRKALARRRIGWSFPWVSSGDSDFNFDYKASATLEEFAAGRATYNFEIRSNTMSEMVGASVFYRSGPGEVYHGYSCHARGVEMVNGAHHVLDLVPKGRNGGGLRSPTEWVKRHGQY